MVLRREHVDVLGGQPVSALVSRRGGRFDAQQAGDGLLLEPLASVARRDARRVRKLRRRHPSARRQGGIQAELLAQIDAEDLERLNRRVQQTR